MRADQIREKYLKFFEGKGHKIIPSSSLVPESDPTVLFTTAGMHPLVPYLLGQKHPLGKRLCDVQKCLRTDDIDEVGDETHLTFFEMLGNWSLGDYFKKEAIEWSFEFLTNVLKIPLEKLAISVFAGEPENNIPRDEESAKIWEDLGIPKERIVYLGREENWWGPAGKTGPCGPDTEVFYWTSQKKPPRGFDPEDTRWFEVWNDVFMQYNKTEEGRFVPLSQKNVDTGMGLERIAAALQGKESVFETDLFLPIIDNLKSQISRGKSKSKNSKLNEKKPLRIIADHLKASVFILAEQVAPSNLERGYVLRRLIRRAIRYGRLLGIEQDFTVDVAKAVIKIYKSAYPEVAGNQDFIFEELQKEERRFKKALEKGFKELKKIQTISDLIFEKVEAGRFFFDIYQNFGLPPEMVLEELERDKKIREISDKKRDEWLIAFQKELKKHQALSRVAAKGKFKSGLADHSEKTIKYHTTTHLLHSALRKVLGESVQQMGSNITPERLRFDFSFDRKLSAQEIKKVEDLINQKIKEDLEIKVEEMPLKEAQKQGALAFFRERYPEKVKVYTIFDRKTGEVFSKEICSGPHCEKTSELGRFKIIKEKASSAGVRRIRAILK